MKTAVHLHGHLADKYGSRFLLEVESVVQAINLLQANFSTFYRDLAAGSYGVWVGNSNITQGELMNPSKGQDIHIIPAIAGSGGADPNRVGFFGPKKSNATGFLMGPHNFPSDSKLGQVVRVIVGIVLVIVGTIFSAYGGIYWGVYPGLGLIFGGVSDYITYSSLKKLTPMINEQGEQKVSTYFNGAVNTVAQGNPVPVLYGRLVVGSQVVSGALTDI
jgi:predicted phage tail protein